MSNNFVTPKTVTTIAQSRINYNDSITSLLDNFSSTGAPGPSNISLEGTNGLRTGMLWYKSGSDTSQGQGRLFVYNGSEFTRNGINSYKVPSVSAANSAVQAGELTYGELVVVGTDSLFIVNTANTGVIPLSAGTAENAALLDGLDSSQFLRSDEDDSMSGKLTVTDNVSVSQNIGIGISNPIAPIHVAKDIVIVKLNDTNGSIGSSVNSFIQFEASGTIHGQLGFANTATGTMNVTNRQGNVVIESDTNNLKSDSAILFKIDNSTKAVLLDSGRLGINTATPNQNLQVVGTANFTGAVSAASFTGSGSGVTNVNASQLDSLNSSQFLRSDESDSMSGTLTVTGDVNAANFNSTSDLSFKKDIVKIDSAVEKLSKINGYTFTYKATEQRSAGVIAQEVEQVLPELVSGTEGSKTVAYGNLVALLIEAIKEQQIQIERLQSGR